jgi:hypothetical protein
LKHPDFSYYKLVILKSRKPRKRIPKWIYVLKRPRKTYVIYELYKITKLSKYAKEYLKNYMDKWLSEHEFRNVMTTAIRMSHRREEIVNKYLKNLDKFIMSDIPKVEVVRKKLEIKCPTILNWISPSFVMMYGKKLLPLPNTELYEYSKTYHIYIYENHPYIRMTIVIPKECSELNMDAIDKILELPDYLLEHLIIHLKTIINKVDDEELKPLVDAVKTILMIITIMNK